MGKTSLGTGRTATQNESMTPKPKMTLSQLRHDIRNHLNAIKLSCALLYRRHNEEMTVESLHEIEHAADGINELVTRFMGDADAPNLLVTPSDRE
ncbi:MAG: histidine kinase dimerization/phospho-acceptor domain-containing protein [Bacillota bacterium]